MPSTELCKLGFLVSERSVSRYMPKKPAGPDSAKVVALPRVGEIHHRYEWSDSPRIASCPSR